MVYGEGGVLRAEYWFSRMALEGIPRAVDCKRGCSKSQNRGTCAIRIIVKLLEGSVDCKLD